ncbi:MAG: CYTH domain-containing protein [Pyrinomonadaceae bacterium]
MKSQREDETEVANAKEMIAVLEGLGYKPSLIYEKRRKTWNIGGVEVVLDELPFGLFAEIEGEEEDIISAEISLDLSQVPAEMRTYPELAAEHGKRIGEMIESRF